MDEILRARAEVFVVEQNCVYQDLDGIDYESLHVFFEEDGKVTAYLRAFRKDTDIVQMGRVLTLHHGTGLGGRILKGEYLRSRRRCVRTRYTSKRSATRQVFMFASSSCRSSSIYSVTAS